MLFLLGLIVLGVLAGILSGLIGIGGGVLIVPSLIFFFGFTQKIAQGTTLALLVLPIGILAAWTYYKQGYVDFRVVALITLGFIVGGWLGAQFATRIPNVLLAKLFGIVLILIGLKMVFWK